MIDNTTDQDGGETEYTNNQYEVSDDHIKQIAMINDSLKEELTAVVEQMETQLIRI